MAVEATNPKWLELVPKEYQVKFKRVVDNSQALVCIEQGERYFIGYIRSQGISTKGFVLTAGYSWKRATRQSFYWESTQQPRLKTVSINGLLEAISSLNEHQRANLLEGLSR